MISFKLLMAMAVFCALSLSACKRQPPVSGSTLVKGGEEKRSGLVDAREASFPRANENDRVASTNSRIQTVNLSKKIQDLHHPIDVEATDKLFEDFVEAWKPEGKSAVDLMSHLGKPTRMSSFSVTYWIDNGKWGLGWKFNCSEGFITSYERVDTF